MGAGNTLGKQELKSEPYLGQYPRRYNPLVSRDHAAISCSLCLHGCRVLRLVSGRSVTTTKTWRASASGSRAFGRSTCGASPTTFQPSLWLIWLASGAHSHLTLKAVIICHKPAHLIGSQIHPGVMPTPTSTAMGNRVNMGCI